MPVLTGDVAVGARTAPSRVVFGPHETNLARRRDISDRHVAYYARRAAGGAGVIVTETASVAPDDWPYERAPLAADASPGWAEVAAACAPHGPLVLAGLGHAGGQGSSAYSQRVLWAPSRVADALTREMPAALESDGLAALVAGFADAARRAVAAGLAGVELDAGPVSLLRQFHSGLTNHRDDAYGEDRLRLTREVIAAVRAAVGPEGIVALRLCGDELAPWAGVTPEQAAAQVAALAGSLDLLTVVRGGPYSVTAYRPDGHTPAGFNAELCRAMREAAAGATPVALQGSVVDPAAAQAALDDGTADLVEMTRALIADPRLPGLVRDGAAGRVRPCILCNQACRVRDARNPIVSCVGEPRSGHETDEPDEDGADDDVRDALVVGGGPAGLECARVLALRGHRVRLVERADALGGALRAGAAALPGHERATALADWLEAEARRHGAKIETGRALDAEDLDAARADGATVVLATGSRAAARRYHPAGAPADVADAEGHPGPEAPDADEAPAVLDAAVLLADGPESVPPGPVVVHDPVGGPVGIGVAELLADAGRDVVLVTPDQVAGTLLSLTGDLADANVRLQRAGVPRALRALLREVGGGRAVLEDVWTGERRTIDCAVLVDAGHRLPEEALYAERPGTPRAGDCVAPRTVLEAVLEGRRRALEVGAGRPDAAAEPAGAARS